MPSPSSKTAKSLQHVLENAQRIFTYTEAMTLEAFESDMKTYDAVERCLQRITEAIIRLGPDAHTLMPDQPIERIRGFGNRLRHNYDDIEEERLWDVIKIDLPKLCAAAEAALLNLSK